MKIFNIQNIEKKKAYWCRPPYKRCRCSIVCASKHSSSAQPNKTQLIPPNNLPHNPTLHHPSTQKKTQATKSAPTGKPFALLFSYPCQWEALFSLSNFFSVPPSIKNTSSSTPNPPQATPGWAFFKRNFLCCKSERAKSNCVSAFEIALTHSHPHKRLVGGAAVGIRGRCFLALLEFWTRLWMCVDLCEWRWVCVTAVVVAAHAGEKCESRELPRPPFWRKKSPLRVFGRASGTKTREESGSHSTLLRIFGYGIGSASKSNGTVRLYR